MTFLANAHIFFFYYMFIEMCSALVCFIIHGTLSLSLRETSSIILFIPIWVLWIFVPGLSQDSRFQIYMLELIKYIDTFLFSDGGRLIFMIVCYLSKALDSIPMLHMNLFLITWKYLNILSLVNVFLGTCYYFIIHVNFMALYIVVEHHLNLLHMHF